MPMPSMTLSGKSARSAASAAAVSAGSLIQTLRMPVAATSADVASKIGRTSGTCGDPPSHHVLYPSCSTSLAASPARSRANDRYVVQMPIFPMSMTPAWQRPRCPWQRVPASRGNVESAPRARFRGIAPDANRRGGSVRGEAAVLLRAVGGHGIVARELARPLRRVDVGLHGSDGL